MSDKPDIVFRRIGGVVDDRVVWFWQVHMGQRFWTKADPTVYLPSEIPQGVGLGGSVMETVTRTPEGRLATLSPVNPEDFPIYEAKA